MMPTAAWASSTSEGCGLAPVARGSQQAVDAEQGERGEATDGGVDVEPRGGEHPELGGGACRVAAGQAVVTALPGSPAVTTGNQSLVRSASRCKAKLQVNDTSSAARQAVSQAGFSVDSRGQVPSTAMSLGSTRQTAAPATATDSARQTMAFQVTA